MRKLFILFSFFSVKWESDSNVTLLISSGLYEYTEFKVHREVVIDVTLLSQETLTFLISDFFQFNVTYLSPNFQSCIQKTWIYLSPHRLSDHPLFSEIVSLRPIENTIGSPEANPRHQKHDLCFLTASGTHRDRFSFSWASFWSLFQWLNEWERVFLFGQVWMILHFPLTMISLKWHFWGTMQLQRLHGTPKKSLPGAKFLLRLSHPCNPINPLHRVCQIVLMCIYVCVSVCKYSWQSFNWVITNGTWTYVFHTYMYRDF